MSKAFGGYLRTLRKSKGKTLKQVEAEAEVSNAYISMVERGLRNPPHPDILNRLAKVYEVSAQEMLIQAGYLHLPSKEQIERAKIDRAYHHVVSDPNYGQGTRLKGTPSLEVKRFVVEMYEKATGRQLLSEN